MRLRRWQAPTSDLIGFKFVLLRGCSAIPAPASFLFPSELEASGGNGNDEAAAEGRQQCKALSATLVKRLKDLGEAAHLLGLAVNHHPDWKSSCLFAGTTATDAMLASGQDVMPREMTSLATVNVAWGALTKQLTSLPGSAQFYLADGGWRRRSKQVFGAVGAWRESICLFHF